MASLSAPSLCVGSPELGTPTVTTLASFVISLIVDDPFIDVSPIIDAMNARVRASLGLQTAPPERRAA